MNGLVEVKTSELRGRILDCLVAMVLNDAEKLFFNSDGYTNRWHRIPPCYSSDWDFGGPLIQQYQVALTPEAHDGREGTEMSERWLANIYYGGGDQYSTDACDHALIAACRAIVATKFGDTIQVPEEFAQ
jgi:hypothetical protein